MDWSTLTLSEWFGLSAAEWNALSLGNVSTSITPIQDITVAGWTPIPLHEQLADLADNTYIKSPSNPNDEECDVKFGQIPSPGNLTISYRYRGTTTGMRLTVSLHQGTNSTPIHQEIISNASVNWTTGSFEVTPDEAGNITDYTDLHIRFKAMLNP